MTRAYGLPQGEHTDMAKTVAIDPQTGMAKPLASNPGDRAAQDAANVAQGAAATDGERKRGPREEQAPGILLFTLGQAMAYAATYGEPLALETAAKQLGLASGAMLQDRVHSAWAFARDVREGKVKVDDTAAPFIGFTPEDLDAAANLHLVSFDPSVERTVTPTALQAGIMARNEDGSVLVAAPHKVAARFRWSIGSRVLETVAGLLLKSRRAVSVQSAGDLARELAAAALREAGAMLAWQDLDRIGAAALALVADMASKAKGAQEGTAAQ